MSTRAKFVYFVLALIVAFTGLATAAFTATQSHNLADWQELESAGFNRQAAGEPVQVLAGDCNNNPSATCP
jgi:hypothetical protein